MGLDSARPPGSSARPPGSSARPPGSSARPPGSSARPSGDAAAPSVIAAAGLGMDYGSVQALVDLDLDVGAGVTGLVGANGAGKSTLIKILLGLLTPTSGTASVLGHDIAHASEQIRRIVGYMPEHDCLPPDVSASDFVVHLGRMSGLPAAAARERAADVLRHVGLDEERYRPMGGYSTGMKQRAKLAQGLVHDPALIFLDEPTNGLDPAARADMLALVRRIGTDFGIPVLVTSHLLGELEQISDHVIVLDGGRLLRSSATGDFLERTGGLLVEVIGGETERDQLGEAIAAAGLSCRPRGRMVVIDPPPDHLAAPGVVHDLVRDTTADLGLALMRLQPDRRHLEDVFRDPATAGAGPTTEGATRV